MPARILLKTTIGAIENDWNVRRFSLLAQHLRSLRDLSGSPLYEVVAHNRAENAVGDDVDLADLAGGAYDQLWLICVDVTGALTPGDVGHITRFRSQGGGILLSRDHEDLGACITKLGPLGATQYFHTTNPDPDESHHCPDDRETPSISWPNFHSGRNGDLQSVTPVEPAHPLMRRSSGGNIRFLPAHPHEGSVGVPKTLETVARVVAQGRSMTTGTWFNLCVAIEEPGMGRAVSDASFHHFCDYNWDPRKGAPTFVTEPRGDGVLESPDSLDDTHQYVENIAAWLSGRV